jgi:hypothetical protein
LSELLGDETFYLTNVIPVGELRLVDLEDVDTTAAM